MSAAEFEKAFRSQLLLSDQLQLFDVWCNLADGRMMPDRSDFKPSQVPNLLPNISLIDIGLEPMSFRMRLAGSRLREIYNRDMTGIDLFDFDWGELGDFWLRTYERIVGTCQPEQGVIKGPMSHKEHLTQFWMRLPLSFKGRTPGMILCFDSCIPANRLAGSR